MLGAWFSNEWSCDLGGPFPLLTISFLVYEVGLLLFGFMS